MKEEARNRTSQPSLTSPNTNYMRKVISLVLSGILLSSLLTYSHFNSLWTRGELYVLTAMIISFVVGMIAFSIFLVRITSGLSKHFAVFTFLAVLFFIYWILIIFSDIYAIEGLLASNGSAIPKNELSSISLYFSIVTFTTVGFGDFIPSASSRYYAAAEALLSYVSMAVLVASAVSLARRFALSPKEIEKFFPNEDSLGI